MRLALAVCAALLLACTGTQAALEATSFTFKFDSPAKYTASGEMTMTGEEAQDMRMSADEGEDGNGDGTVSQAEADALKAMFAEFMEEGANEEDPITIDGKEPKTESMSITKMAGLTGDVDSDDPIVIGIKMTAAYDVKAGEKHTVLFPAGEEEEEDDPFGGEDVVLTMQAPPGYIIASKTGWPASAKLSSDKTKLTVEASEMSTTSEQTLVFEKGSAGGEDSPAVGVALGALLLGLACVSRRRAW